MISFNRRTSDMRENQLIDQRCRCRLVDAELDRRLDFS